MFDEQYSDSFNKNKKFVIISKLKKQLDDFSELEGNNSEDNKEGESYSRITLWI
jgi:hypothetical protein